MFRKITSFINRKKLEKDAKTLTENIILLVTNDLPDMAENYLHWSLDYVILTKDNSLTTLHRTNDNNYYNSNRQKHNKHFILTGVEIFNKNLGDFVPIKLTVTYNLIQNIAIPFDKSLSKTYNLSQLRITELHQKSFTIQNPELAKLKKLLLEFSEAEKALLEIEDTFEIELEGKNYYTILSMDDGNYIAIDKKQRVFRLIHDHEEPAKSIFNNLKEFFAFYNGDKEQLAMFMEF